MKINAEIGAQILAMARQGRSERAIVAALGPGAPSRATVRRYIDRMAAEKPPKAAPASDRALPGIPSDPDELAEAPLAQLDWWGLEIREAFERAKLDANIAAQASLAARAVAVLEARRKAAPPEQADPNAYPDLVEAAERCKALLRRRHPA
jgi:hypothetical protein